MPSNDDLQYIGIILGILLTAAAVWRKVVVPVWRAMWRAIRRMDQVGDEILGDRAKGIPSMADRVAATTNAVSEVRAGLAEHLDWHSARGRHNSERPPDPARR